MRIPGKIAASAALFICTYAAVMLLCMFMNHRFVHIGDHGALPAHYSGDLYALDMTPSAKVGEYELRFSGNYPLDALTFIAYGSEPVQLFINGESTVLESSSAMSSSLHVTRIPHAVRQMHTSCSETWTLHVNVFTDTQDVSPRIYICSGSALKKISTTLDICVPLIYGMLLAATLYGFSLYHFRPMHALFLFALYTFSVFLWCVGSYLSPLFSEGHIFISELASWAFSFAVVLGAATSISFCQIPLPSSLRALTKRSGILLVYLLFAILCKMLPEHLASNLQSFIYVGNVVILILCCDHTPKKPNIVIIGLAITQALRFCSTHSSAFLGSTSFYLILMRRARLSTMPYVFSCMFYINSIYGGKFKEAELLSARLEENNRMLDRKVETRTAELVEHQQFRTNLLTNIFHDLRSPLLIMRGCVDGMKDRYADDAQLTILNDRLKFITDLTDDLFAIVKLEDSALIIETEPVSLAPILRSVIDGLSIEAHARGIGIDAHLQHGLVAWGDETWLRRALQNLISNAIYYSKPDGENIQVDMRAENDIIAIRVRDHGVGISKEEQALIFNRYYRVSGTRKHESSGLGLSIAMSVARHHEGSLSVESILGQGTTFTLTLPLWSVESDEADD